MRMPMLRAVVRTGHDLDLASRLVRELERRELDRVSEQPTAAIDTQTVAFALPPP
jgi:hypothetical protein